MSSARERIGAGLAVLAAVLLCAATLVGYVHRALLDPDRFADRSAAALSDPAVRDFVAARITDAVVQRDPDLVAVQPLIRSAASSLVGGQAFRGIFRAAVRDVHRTVIEHDRDTVLLTLGDVGLVLRGALARLDPAAARQIDGGLAAPVLDERLSGDIASAARRLRDATRVALILGLLAALAAAAALALIRDTRRGAATLGVSLAAAAVLTRVGLGVARHVVLDEVGDAQARAAARGLWAALTGDLRTAILLLGLSGAVLAAVAASLIEPVSLGEPPRRAWALVVTTPKGSARRTVRALALITAGVIVVTDPAAAQEAVALVAGALLIVGGVSELLRLTSPAAPARQRRAAGSPRRLVRALGALPGRAILAGVVVVGGRSATSSPTASTHC